MVTIPPTNELPEDIFENTEEVPTSKKEQESSKKNAKNNTPFESKNVVTPSPQHIDKVLAEQTKIEKPASDAPSKLSSKVSEGKSKDESRVEKQQDKESITEISKETITEIRKEIAKDNNPLSKDSAYAPVDSVIAPPTQEEMHGRQQRMEKGKKGSAFLRIIFIIIIFGIVIVIAGVSYYFFISRVPQEEQIIVPDTINEPTEIIELSALIDTSSWNEYSNIEAGLTLRYPENFVLTRHDVNLGLPNASSTPQLILSSADGNETISIWIDTVGISHFVKPTAKIFGNPLNAGIHLILERAGDSVEVNKTRYFSAISGVVQPDLDSILAYIPEYPGIWKYTFVYSDKRGEASEDFMKAFIETIDLRFDSDGDGIFDDDEADYGTDPNLADTDGDGFDDFTEIKNGYNPLGEGHLNN